MNSVTPMPSLEIPEVVSAVVTTDKVMFPYVILPFTPAREKTVAAVEHALQSQQPVFLMISQRAGTPGDDPNAQEICSVGTVVVARPVMKVGRHSTQVVVQGLTRARVLEIVQAEPCLQVRIQTLEEPDAEGTAEERTLIQIVCEDLRALSTTDGKSLPKQVLGIAEALDSPGRLADLVASNLDTWEAQEILETIEPVKRLRRAAELLSDRIQYLKLRAELEARVQEDVGKSRHEYILRQQLKSLQEQLGEGGGLEPELDRYLYLAKEKSLPGPARSEVERCVQRLRWTSSGSDAEGSSLCSYLDCVTSLPWNNSAEEAVVDIQRAEKILNEHYWGLETVKERILEFLAVQELKPSGRGPILCFLGPPGVGKTSLCRCIALALGRQFLRVPLGGVRDEAQIRGHRRAYVGAMPGALVQGMLQSGTTNPVIVLDEIDKISGEGLKNPAAALLEALDPEQNSEFHDHYLGIPYDLSRVFFLATANSANTISPTLLDRLEVISLTGYTEEEKVRIARHSLIRRSLESSGLAERDLRITDAALRRIVRNYTQEAGLREFERQLGKIARKVALRRARGDRGSVSVGVGAVADYLGPKRRFASELLQENRVGAATGLVWTPFGGDLMFIEVLALSGSGKLLLTGQLGNVMKESAQTALSVARDFAEKSGLGSRFFFERDLHIHLPAGSVPKEGASSGVTIATAIISLLVGRSVRRKVAMTGEISLHGRVLPVTGIREKILAARVAGVKEVIMPEQNRLDVEGVQSSLRGDLRFHYVSEITEVLDIAMLPRRPGQPAAAEA